MVAHATTVAFLGLEARTVDVQVQISQGLPAFAIVGLPDKAVNESRERVRAALTAIGLALPPRRIVVNLSPADLPKEGSHFDLAIASALLAAMGLLDAESIAHHVIVGELGLDGRISPVPGVLLAALHAVSSGLGLVCPAAQGSEAAWAGEVEILAAPHLLALVNHLKGHSLLPAPPPGVAEEPPAGPDLRDVKGQESAKRALEVAAAGNHNLLMCGPPGAGKSLLAACLPGILPPLDAEEALEVSMIASASGALDGGRISRARPYRAPHHSASMAALTGGGMKARPGEMSLAHMGVLFLDELPEFHRTALEALRQPLETGRITVARAQAHVTYPARVQLVAAMNPCRCGYMGDAARACPRAPRCGQDYQSRISGPLLDRIDLRIDVTPVSVRELTLPATGENSAQVAARVAAARAAQRERYREHGVRTNAEADGSLLEQVAAPDAAGRRLLMEAVETLNLSARGYHRVLRVARTLADLSGAETVTRAHIAEAIAYRQPGGGA